MTMFYASLGLGLYVIYRVYRALAVPRELKHIPAISFGAPLASILRGDPFDVRYERVIRPALEKTGMARVWMQFRWELTLSDPKHIKEILSKGDRFPKNRNPNDDKDRLIRKTLGDSNILLSDGHEWRRHRQIANSSFKANWSSSMFGECTMKLSKLISSKGEAPIRIGDLFRGLTLDVLGKGLFSYDFNALENDDDENMKLYYDISKEVFNPIYSMFPLLENILPSREVSRQNGQKFRSFLRDIVRNRKQNLDQNDLLSNIKASLADKDVDLTEEDVINDLAGHDTTANTLITIFYYLCKHQDIQEKARKEINFLLNNEKRVPTTEESKSLPYIDCIIKESMRIVSTVSQLRRYCREDYELSDGTLIPKDTFVNLQLWKVHHDEEIYPDPYSFNPDRFSKVHGPQDSQSMPFGGGSRMCIGKSFSIMEQRVVLRDHQMLSHAAKPKYLLLISFYACEQLVFCMKNLFALSK